MKRLATRSLLFLLLGAAINIAIAWTIGLTVPNRHSPTPMRGGPKWPQEPPKDWPAADDASENEHFGTVDITSSDNLAELVRTQRSDPTVTVHWMVDSRYGWPMHSLRSTFLAVQTGRTITPVSGTIVESGVDAPQSVNPNGFRFRRLALTPIATGFVANSAFYGGLIAMVVLTISYTRARSRLRRGLCPNCSYPIGTSPVCTECGKPLPPHALRSPVNAPHTAGAVSGAAQATGGSERSG